MNELIKQATEKFKRSDALKFIDSVAKNMTAEDFKRFTLKVLTHAYHKKRLKAIDYMLKVHDRSEPLTLLKIHLAVMLEDKNDLITNQAMLKVLIKHYSPELCSTTLSHIVEHERKTNGADYSARKIVIDNFILQEVLPKNDNMSKKMKI